MLSGSLIIWTALTLSQCSLIRMVYRQLAFLSLVYMLLVARWSFAALKVTRDAVMCRLFVIGSVSSPWRI
ncbi:uncharacterized protein K441DRAFT_743957 [Cenococcum geophilum 1.58]|uniref:Uncharacterized protein n=1 Tax=Cenococcum geophilum 1.58 TaxID=794803 RepID=A0ACC8ELK3_9PEZI|nr:hypothetical protein K441DRAFT_743957 [Cenococcum geophilum 1.58]